MAPGEGDEMRSTPFKQVVKTQPKSPVDAVRKKIEQSMQSDAQLARAAHYEFMFQELIGRKPTPDEVAAGMHLAQTLRLSDGDPLWPILLTYQCYDTNQRENLDLLNASVKEAHSILREITLQAESIRSDYCFIPKGLRKHTPIWLQVFFSMSTLKSAVVVASCLLALASFAIPSSSERVSMLNGGLDFFSTCYFGKGSLKQLRNGDLICLPPSGMEGAYLVRRVSGQ